MSDRVFHIPADIADHLRKVASVLKAHGIRLDQLHELWSDTDPDPENGWFWHVKIEHPEATKLRANLAQAAEFLEWLATFSENGEGGA